MNRRYSWLGILAWFAVWTATAAAPNDPKVYKIGAILAMSGQASIYGTTMSQGIKLAVEEIDAKGGVNGIPLEVVIEDHKGGGGQEGVNAMNRLLTIHGTKIVMTSFTAPTLAIAPIADQEKVFLMNGGVDDTVARLVLPMNLRHFFEAQFLGVQQRAVG
jgi:ABC-type branched-subunit amino acid transport system substrate-binding protein